MNSLENRGEVMVAAYSYKRFSSPQQESGDSIRRQTALLDAWLTRNDCVLDTSLKLTDKGISGYTGEHRINPDRHALATFLEAVKTGRVKRGSFLVVESLDRLSREHVQAGLVLALNLLQSGIKIVQLAPVEMVYDDKSDAMALMMMMMELSRGNSESKTKSIRVGAAWGQKKEQAEKTITTSKIPGWVVIEGVGQNGQRKDYSKAEFTLHHERSNVVRRMFKMAAEGKGALTICRILNGEGIPNWGERSKSKKWGQSTVYHILTSRACIGEYQPSIGDDKTSSTKRKPQGQPIKNYYPAVISDKVFDIVQGSINTRKIVGAGRQSEHINLFSGLMVDARDGGAIHANRANRRPSTYQTANAKTGQGFWSSFPLDGFDNAILSQLKEVSIAPTKAADDLSALSGRLAQVSNRIAALTAAMDDSEDMPELVKKLLGYKTERQSIIDDMDRARQKAASPPSENLADLQSLIGTEDRERLQWAIRRTIEEIRCLFIGGRGEDRTAIVRVKFNDILEVRDYWIDYIPQRAGRWGNRTAESWGVKSIKGYGSLDDNGEGLDIETPEGAAKIDKVIRLLMKQKKAAKKK